MAKLIALLIAALFAAPAQNPTHPQGLPSPAEFPPQDSALVLLVSDGTAKMVAARRLAEAPDSPETVRLLATAKNLEGMLQVLRVIVDTQPRRIADAFEAMGDAAWQFRGDSEQVRHNTDTLRQIVADGRRRLDGLPREEAARAERVFILIDGETSRDRNAGATRLRQFIEAYRGTETALLAEVDLISYNGVTQQMLDALDAFAQAHPGTSAAAKALYQKGFQWHTINTLGRLEPRDVDPTARFMRVLEIVRELENGGYPKSEWVEKAPSLITGFFFPENAPIAAGNIDRLIGIFEEFAAAHFVIDDRSPDGGGVGYLLTSKLADLHEKKGQRTVDVEQTLSRLERRVADPAAVRYLRGLFHLRPGRTESPEERSTRLAKAGEVLRAVSTEGTALVHRRALATLASLNFMEGDHASARASFRKYATSYPESNWAWVAMLRTGQCEEALGDPTAAAAAYLEAARRHPDLPLARVLGHEYAARAYESAGEFEKALIEHQRALDGWDNAFPRYTTYLRQPAKPDDPFVMSTDAGAVARESLAPRIAELKQSLALQGGALLERGRTLLSRGRHDDALAELQRLAAQHPRSQAAVQGRELAHRARLERALQAAAVDRPDTDEARALKELEALAREPHDFAVTAAKIARASLLLKRGEAAEAETSLMDALKEWHASQHITKPANGLEEDVAEIRRLVFLPQGGEIYRSGRWNAFTWPATPPVFTLVSSDVLVKLHTGDSTRVRLVQTFPHAERVLFFDTAQIALLEKMIVTLGGTKRREPRQIMETPNQPVGDSMRILGLWNKVFPARPGHWGGWEVETYPVITEIQFTNAERTRASARVTIGYSGGTVELEKEVGKWIAKRLTSQWIT